MHTAEISNTYMPVKNTVYRGDIYWADMPNKDSTVSIQMGRRPVLIISNNKNNRYSETVTCIPLSTRTNKSGPKYPFHVLVRNILKKDSIVLTEQFVVLSKENLLGNPIAKMPSDDMVRIENAVKLQFGLN